MGETALLLDAGSLWVNFAGQGGCTAYIDYITAKGVPEPASIALLGLDLAGIGFSRRKKV